MPEPTRRRRSLRCSSSRAKTLPSAQRQRRTQCGCRDPRPQRWNRERSERRRQWLRAACLPRASAASGRRKGGSRLVRGRELDWKAASPSRRDSWWSSRMGGDETPLACNRSRAASCRQRERGSTAPRTFRSFVRSFVSCLAFVCLFIHQRWRLES